MIKTAVSAIAALLIADAAAAANREAVPATGTIEFDVYRGDSRFGSHILRFEESGERLQVVSDVDLRVRLGPITVFRYEHDATEVYEDGVLQSFEAETLKDGERLIVDLERSGEQIAGRGTDADGNPLDIQHQVGLTLSSHWQGYEEGTGVILNTETGEEMPVTISELGTETLTIGGREIEARHIRVEGSLTLDLWYGADGEWLRCEFSARGQNIRYVRRNI
jgi:predicted DNA-binding antitoxin AbrB/MazE fold protein